MLGKLYLNNIYKFDVLLELSYLERRERDDSSTMFVKNLPFAATEDSISELFGDSVKE